MPESLRKYFKGDSIIWALLITLSIVSLLSVYSSSYFLAYRHRSGHVSYYMIRHIIFILTGFGVAYITHLIPYRYYSRAAHLLLLLSVPVLLMTLIFATKINEASRWVEMFGVSFQTSDLAKLALIMYLARLLSLKQDKIQSYKEGFLPLLWPVLIICGLIMPANLSTALILFFVSITLMFIGRVRTRYIITMGVLTVAVLAFLIFVAVQLGWEGRWVTWQNRIVHHTQQDSDGNYQAEQSKIAIATGGILGKGPGNSMQRSFLPEPHSDFIYSIIIEEYGLLGGVIVILLYLAILFRAGIIVRKSTRTFAAFLAFGLALLLVTQAMVNMAVAVGILPVTGQTLPMVSMGGTSMVFSSAAIGMILSVSQGTRKKNREEADERT